MSINDILFICVCLAAIYARSISAIAFCSMYAIHSFYSPGMEQWQRYVVLILIDSGVAFLATAINRPSRASIITGVFSGLFLVINVAGFIAWHSYLPPAPYDAICSIAYIAMMAALINEGLNGRRLAVYRLACSDSSLSVRKGLGVHNQDGKKT
ncbi:hypothetical protein [Aeromonas phage 4_4512]|nr:hypothetical protein [Aeromonas phage 4_4512]